MRIKDKIIYNNHLIEKAKGENKLSPQALIIINNFEMIVSKLLNKETEELQELYIYRTTDWQVKASINEPTWDIELYILKQFNKKDFENIINWNMSQPISLLSTLWLKYKNE